jgi:hypothetical protein
MKIDNVLFLVQPTSQIPEFSWDMVQPQSLSLGSLGGGTRAISPTFLIDCFLDLKIHLSDCLAKDAGSYCLDAQKTLEKGWAERVGSFASSLVDNLRRRPKNKILRHEGIIRSLGQQHGLTGQSKSCPKEYHRYS